MVLLAFEQFTRMGFYSHNFKNLKNPRFFLAFFCFFLAFLFLALFFPRFFFLACEEKTDMRGKKKPMF